MLGSYNRRIVRQFPTRIAAALGLIFALLIACVSAWGQTSTQATSVPILLPSGLVYDAQGNLYLAETGAHLVLKISAAGVLSVYAGTGTQGYAGDGGLAVAALLDSPGGLAMSLVGDLYIADTHNHAVRKVDAAGGVITTVAGTGVAGHSVDGTVAAKALLNLPAAVALDGLQNLYVADSRNHQVRRIDHTTGLISTVVGNGTQGFAGDGGSAVSAQIDTPASLVLDAAGNLFIADAHNQRVRRVAAGTGVITTVAGTGIAGFRADGAQATGSALHLPRGITLDAVGNLYIADSANQRVRRVDAATGVITTLAGDGTQGFAGDAGQASSASLNSPLAVALSAATLPTLSDSGNQRVRQVDSSAAIHTIVGLGNGIVAQSGTLTLAAASTMVYGSGAITATLSGSQASGQVTFYDASGVVPQALGTVALSNNVASMSTAYFAAGVHRVSATYAGDSSHAAVQSGTVAVTIAPAPVTATPAAVALLYGQGIPALGGTSVGILSQDALNVSITYGTSATASSHPGAYPIGAALSGSAAGNYSLTTIPAAVTIGKAPVSLTLNTAASPTFTVHAASTTTGAPSGSVALLDGATAIASVVLSASGDASVVPSLSNGSHTLTATYSGDANFLVAQSAPAIVSIGPSATPDFTLVATGATALTVGSGSSAAYSFLVTPLNGSLSSPIQLTASGLPPNATASFNPAYIPPGSANGVFMLTVLTQKAALRPLAPLAAPYVLATCLLLLLRKGRVRGLACLMVAGLVLGMAVGYGDRINNSAAAAVATKSYTVTVTGTATASSGAVLQHSATVMLVVQ